MARNYSRYPSRVNIRAYFFKKEIHVCNFKSRHNCGRDLDIVLEKLEMDVNIAMNWLNNIEMVANPKKNSTYVLSQEYEY